jgi:short subunit fatty acids transporter
MMTAGRNLRRTAVTFQRGLTGRRMANSDSQDVVESSNPASNLTRSVLPTFSSFFRPRMLFAVLGVVLVIGVVSIMARSEAPAVVPHLIGERVDPQLDRLRLRLEAADLALGDVSVVPCPEFDIPGVSIERVPGTIIDQHPARGENVVLSTAVDVTVCLPNWGLSQAPRWHG